MLNNLSEKFSNSVYARRLAVTRWASLLPLLLLIIVFLEINIFPALCALRFTFKNAGTRRSDGAGGTGGRGVCVGAGGDLYISCPGGALNMIVN